MCKWDDFLKTKRGLEYLLGISFPKDSIEIVINNAINLLYLDCKNIMKQFELKWLEHGQRRPYGDSYYTCEIHTEEEMSDNEILIITKEKGRLPYEEWKKRMDNIDDYFKGYYTIEKTSYGYLYKGVYPYDD